MQDNHNLRYRAAGLGLLRLEFFIGLVCLVIALLVWATTISRLDAEREQILARTRAKAAQLAQTFEQYTLRALQGAEQLALVARDEYLQHGAVDLRGWRQRGVLDTPGWFAGAIRVLDAQGQVVADDAGGADVADGAGGAGGGRATTDILQGPGAQALAAALALHRQDPLATLRIGAPMQGDGGRWWVPLSMRITRANGSFAGLVWMVVDAAQFSQFHPHDALGEMGGTILVNADGIALVRRVGTQLRYGGDVKGSEAYRRYHVEPQATYYSRSTVDDDDRILSHRTLAPYGVIVAIGISVRESLAAFEQRRLVSLRVATAATVGLALFALVVGSLLRRSRRAVEALRSSEAVFRATFNQAATGVFHAAPDGRFLRVNAKFGALLGYPGAELVGRSMHDIAHPDDQATSRERNALLLQGPAHPFSAETEKRYLRSDGSTVWVSESLGMVARAGGGAEFMVGLVQDISVRKALQERLAHEATHDPLTGLPNRGLLLDRLASSLKQAHRRGKRVGVCFIDLDGFKAVNDSLGHACGDLLLQQVARRLPACVREADTVGRLGGDEFVVVLDDILDSSHCAKVAAKIIDALARPYDLRTPEEVRVSASLGIAVSPQDGDDALALLQAADDAMYQAKAAGKNAYRFHSELDPVV